MGRSLLHREHAETAAGQPTGDPADRLDAQQRRDRSTDAAVPAAGSERPPVGERGAVGDEVEDEVVGLVGPGEVLLVVVDDLVGTDVSHELELGRVVDGGDVGAEPLGELDGERARSAAGPVDQHPLPGTAPLVPCSAMAPACGIVDASSKGRSGGLGASTDSGTTAYSAKPPFSARLSP